MIRHIVLFKLKTFEDPSEKAATMQQIKSSLEALKGKIAELNAIRVDFNVNPAESWDIVLTTEHDSLENLSKYASHPDHVAVSKNVIGPVKADRACVDYECSCQ